MPCAPANLPSSRSLTDRSRGRSRRTARSLAGLALLVTTVVGNAAEPAAVPAVAPAAAAAATAPAKDRFVDGFPLIGFEKLAAFDFKAPGYESGAPDPKAIEAGEQQIPSPIKALNETQVAVTGFMLPVKMDGGLVKEFLLVKDPMLCCYGVMPRVNEWVVVKMTGKGVQPLMDVPITFVGRLRVGQMFENGYLTGIYLLEGDRMAEVKG